MSTARLVPLAIAAPLVAALAIAAAPSPACAALPDGIALFPLPGASGVNPDTPLRISCDRPLSVQRAGRILVLDAASGAVAASIDLTAAITTQPDRPDTPLLFPALPRTIGGTVYNCHPVTVEDTTATIHLPAGTLDYGRTYRIVVEPGVLAAASDSVDALADGIPADAGWTFSTRSEAPVIGRRIVVAADGSGDFSTLQGAIDALPETLTEPHEIFLRDGTYVELVNTGRHLTLRGESRSGTRLVYPNSNRLNPGSALRAVLTLDAEDVTVRDLTIRNTTPKGGSQAEAIRSNRDRTLLTNLDLHSFQDTLQVATGSAFVHQCHIEGDVDFLWGFGAAYLLRCELRSVFRGYLVQARNPPGSRGFVFVDCRLTRADGLAGDTVYLGRVDPAIYPGSETVFINCAMGPHIRPVGWLTTRDAPGPELQWAEYASTDLDGNSLDTTARLADSRQLTAEEAARYRDPAFVLGGWVPPLP